MSTGTPPSATTPALRGETWTARQVRPGTYLVSIANRAEIIGAIKAFLRNQSITSAQLSGIGALDRAVLRFFNPDTKQYVDREFREQLEVTNLTGNLALKGQEPILHLHGTLGRADYTALAGHVLEADVRGAGEIYVTVNEVQVYKKHSDEIGLDLYALD